MHGYGDIRIICVEYQAGYGDLPVFPGEAGTFDQLPQLVTIQIGKLRKAFLRGGLIRPPQVL